MHKFDPKRKHPLFQFVSDLPPVSCRVHGVTRDAPRDANGAMVRPLEAQRAITCQDQGTGWVDVMENPTQKWKSHRKTIGKWWLNRSWNGIYPLVMTIAVCALEHGPVEIFSEFSQFQNGDC